MRGVRGEALKYILRVSWVGPIYSPMHGVMPDVPWTTGFPATWAAHSH